MPLENPNRVSWLADFHVTGYAEVDCCKQAMSELCAFHSPFTVSMSDMEIYRQPALRSQYGSHWLHRLGSVRSVVRRGDVGTR